MHLNYLINLKSLSNWISKGHRQNSINHDPSFVEKNIIGKLASRTDIESLIFLKNKNLSLDQIYTKEGEAISISRQF